MKERGINFEEVKYIPQNLKKHKIKIVNSGIIAEKKCNPYVINEVGSYLQDNKKILIVLNTINAAKIVYENLKKEFPNKNCMLLHSQFTLADRKKKEEAFEDKNNNKNLPDILVATQVVEVSLDIDYDVLITELAPLDSLFQRMGRILRRYREDFKYNEEKPNVLIYGVREKEEEEEEIRKNVSGAGNVYKIDVLLETSKLIKSKIKSKNNKLRGENEKIKLVEEFYKNLEKENYFIEFEKTLDILDSLYSAESKHKAQKIFRDIIQISGIPSNKIDEFLNGLAETIDDMGTLVECYDRFYKDWRGKYKKVDENKKERLKKKLKNLGEFKRQKREINSKVFELIADSQVTYIRART